MLAITHCVVKLFVLMTLFTIFVRASIGPNGLRPNESTTCEQFSEYARFNPYSVLDSEWMVFYYWAPVQKALFYRFVVPSNKTLLHFQKLLDGHVEKPVNWSSKLLLMKQKNNATFLLVEQNDRGHYNLYIPYKGMTDDGTITMMDIRFKQTGDNRYVAFMLCEKSMVFVMSRISEIPPKKKIQDAAARIGYRGRGGKSYLYQGHHWMPIPEGDDRIMSLPHEYYQKRWYLYD